MELGFEHILDVNGLDHVLFLVVLTIMYTFREWKTVLLLATAFTIGHSITLAMSALNIITIDSRLIEILIAVSIFLTALIDLLPKPQSSSPGLMYGMALFFGFFHGMGFSNFFKTILGKDDITIPLLAFNIGVELAQIIVVFLCLLVNYLIIKYLGFKRKFWILLVSGSVAFWALTLILDRI
ncbi:MAG: HupE/UreJ family protein [Bacteroidia bacterium]|nr:HupE/UreJ family protein [Bacteroidia bacterium]